MLEPIFCKLLKNHKNHPGGEHDNHQTPPQNKSPQITIISWFFIPYLGFGLIVVCCKLFQSKNLAVLALLPVNMDGPKTPFIWNECLYTFFDRLIAPINSFSAIQAFFQLLQRAPWLCSRVEFQALRQFFSSSGFVIYI